MTLSQHDEVRMLNRDMLEIYSVWGTPELKLLKHVPNCVDDVYNEDIPKYVEYNCVGRYIPTPVEEMQTGVGLGKEEAFYTIYLVRSVLQEQGINEITVRDKVSYKGIELDILSVVPSTVVGNYSVSWKIQARGKNLPSMGVTL